MKGLFLMDKMFMNYPDMMNVSQLQEALGIGRNMAYNLIKGNKIKSLKIGKNIRIPKAFLIDYVQQHCYNYNSNGLVYDGGVV